MKFNVGDTVEVVYVEQDDLDEGVKLGARGRVTFHQAVERLVQIDFPNCPHYFMWAFQLRIVK